MALQGLSRALQGPLKSGHTLSSTLIFKGLQGFLGGFMKYSRTIGNYRIF